jgi:hypothetical protein
VRVADRSGLKAHPDFPALSLREGILSATRDQRECRTGGIDGAAQRSSPLVAQGEGALDGVTDADFAELQSGGVHPSRRRHGGFVFGARHGEERRYDQRRQPEVGDGTGRIGP